MCDHESTQGPNATSANRTRVNVSIDVPKLQEGLDFYCPLFGWTETARPFPTMAVLDGNNVTICMHEKASGSPSSATGGARSYERHWTPVHLDLHVSDFDSIVSQLVDLGGRIEREFRDQGPCPVAFCCDPFGNGLCLLGPRT